MFADAAPLGDSTDSIANGSWDWLAPGDGIEFTAAYTVVQGDIDNP
jgi:large repetitive protein